MRAAFLRSAVRARYLIGKFYGRKINDPGSRSRANRVNGQIDSGQAFWERVDIILITITASVNDGVLMTDNIIYLLASIGRVCIKC